MKMSEFIGKEIVNIFDGARLGTVNETDLIIDAATGSVESIVLPNKQNVFSLRLKSSPIIIPWEAVRKIGSQLIVIDLEFNRAKHNET